jgi:hypothetical protein
MGNRPLLRPTPPGGPAPRLTSVDGQFDTTGYLRTTSDIVALMLLEHQTQAANLITRAGWEARLGDPARTKAAAEALADYLLFVGEARIDEPIEGTSAFARAFQSRGPRDAMGRSLRDLQLDGRLMRYPLSYMVGTPMFDALPEEAAAIVRARLAAVLTGRDTSLRYAHLSAADRQAIIEILDATKPLLQIGR